MFSRAQYSRSQPPRYNPPQSRPATQPVKPAPQPVRQTPQPVAQTQGHPNDDHSVGMRYQSASVDEDTTFVSAIIALYLDQIKDFHMDEYVTEDGVLTNLDVHIDPPQLKDILFKFDANDNSLIFVLQNVSLRMDTDLNLYFGALKGHVKLDIKNLNIDLKTIPVTEDGEERLSISYHLHLKDADIKADIKASEDLDSFPTEFSDDFMPLFTGNQAIFQIAAQNAIDDALVEETQKAIDNYLKLMSTEINIPKNFGHKVQGNCKIGYHALPIQICSDRTIVVDYDTKSEFVRRSENISEKVSQNMKREGNNENNELVGVRGDLTKHHVFIAPHLVSGVMHNLDLDQTSFKISDQAKLQEQVRNYFGSDIELECYNHESEFPEYKNENDAIVGKQTVKCSLHPKGQKFDSLYDIDLKLNFNIHPQVTKDGKSLKAEFGNIQATSLNVHDKRMEISTTISDGEDDLAVMNNMNGKRYSSTINYKCLDANFCDTIELLIPFLMSMKLEEESDTAYHQSNLSKFTNILKTPNLIDIPQLESELFK